MMTSTKGPHSITIIPPGDSTAIATAVGSMTVSFKMNVVTSGPHDGLFITTGIQTNGGANGGFITAGAAGNHPWWRGMERTSIQSAPSQQAIIKEIGDDQQVQLQEPPAAATTTTTTTNTKMHTTESRSMIDEVEVKVEEETRATNTEYKSASLTEFYKSTTAADDAPLTPEHLRARMSGYTTINGIFHTSNPQSTEAIHPPATVKLNIFGDSAGDGGGGGQRAVELSMTPYLLNDTTTTTTTVEVFRADPIQQPAADYYRLPPGPLSGGEAELLVPAVGPPYEVTQRTETHFSNRPTTTQPQPQRYYVTEPSTNTSMYSSRSNLPPPSLSQSQWDGAQRSRSQSRAALGEQSRPQSSAFTGSPLSSNWQLNQPPQSEPSPTTTTTILRRQHNQREESKIIENDEQLCPPIPPKRQLHPAAIRLSASQPNVGVVAPPRPSTRKPHHLNAAPPPHDYGRRSRGTRRTPTATPTYQQQRPRSVATTAPQYQSDQQQMGMRSASSNEIFKLYQTRDCLGNVLYEFHRQRRESSPPPLEKEHDLNLIDHPERDVSIELDDSFMLLGEDDFHPGLDNFGGGGGDSDGSGSDSSSSFASDLSPSAEMLCSRFVQHMDSISMESIIEEKIYHPTLLKTFQQPRHLELFIIEEEDVQTEVGVGVEQSVQPMPIIINTFATSPPSDPPQQLNELNLALEKLDPEEMIREIFPSNEGIELAEEPRPPSIKGRIMGRPPTSTQGYCVV